MTIKYTVQITDAETHMVSVKLTLTPPKDVFKVFLPSWSPGSYLMREYAKNIRTFKVNTQNGEFVYFEKRAKGTWEIDLSKSSLNKKADSITIEYLIYCHELTVRTSHVDNTHAFLHGPSYLMGVMGQESQVCEIEFYFPALWSKLSTSLKDISNKREHFIYQAPSYDDLIDTPVEIGCQETDGFLVEGIPHHLTFYGNTYAHDNKIKEDIETIVKTVLKTTIDIPYDTYLFLTHFKPNLYGGLEHKSSTALHFDGRKLFNRKDYLNFLALVAHEYFHTWNVKRIRPRELGPFDYLNENYTSMHWLTEGLTSFMDELFILRAGLCTMDEYLEMQATNLKNYYKVPGKKFDSLEQSSMDAWIKLYRPDENSKNSTISYYLKGGLVFSVLNILLTKENSSIDEFIKALWQAYKARPQSGFTKDEVLKIISDISSSEVSEKFNHMISATEDIDFEKYYSEVGLSFEWEESSKSYLGMETSNEGKNIIIQSVELDGPAYKSGLNAKDEIIAINSNRIISSELSSLGEWLKVNQNYEFLVSRLGTLQTITVSPGKTPRVLKKIKMTDENKVKKVFNL